MKKKFLAVVLAATMVVGGAMSVSAATTVPAPVADYDFTGSKLNDKSTHKLPDVVIDAENTADNGTENSANAVASEDGITIANGFVLLPSNIFSDSAVTDIKGLTVSMTYTKKAQNNPAGEPFGWGGEWSESLFNFNTTRLFGDVQEADRSDKSFGVTYNGNIGTGIKPNKDQGNWIDGGLGGKLPNDEKHVVTITYDVATNVATEYVDGEYVTDSSKTEWEIKTSLTAEDIKNFKALNIGHRIDGAWGMWSFCTVGSFTAFTSALNAEQVKALYDGSAVVEGTETPVNDTPASNDKPAKTGDAFTYIPFAVLALAAVVVVAAKKKTVNE